MIERERAMKAKNEQNFEVQMKELEKERNDLIKL